MTTQRKYTLAEQEEHRIRLLNALRSGGYQQGYNYLRTGDCFCVLGVACDLSRLGTWQPRPYDDSEAISADTVRHAMFDYVIPMPESFSSASLPDEVRDYYGFHDHIGRIAAFDLPELSLLELNDFHRLDFPAIADYITRNASAIFA